MVSSVKVFKKNSPNGKLTVYLGKRDFVDHLDHVDPIEGVVVVENDYLLNRKIFCQVRECLLMLMSSSVFIRISRFIGYGIVAIRPTRRRDHGGLVRQRTLHS